MDDIMFEVASGGGAAGPSKPVRGENLAGGGRGEKLLPQLAHVASGRRRKAHLHPGQAARLRHVVVAGVPVDDTPARTGTL
jgi:hypothetical protein